MHGWGQQLTPGREVVPAASEDGSVVGNKERGPSLRGPRNHDSENKYMSEAQAEPVFSHKRPKLSLSQATDVLKSDLTMTDESPIPGTSSSTGRR